EVHGQERALLDAGRGVGDDVFKAVVGQLLEHPFHALAGQRVLVAGLRGGQDEQVVEALVLDQRLLERGLALHHVDEVVHHPALAAHDQVEVAQANVEIDHRGLLAAPGQSAGNAGAGGGLANAALAGGDYDDLGQCRALRIVVLVGSRSAAHSSAAIRSSSPSSQTWAALPWSSRGISSSTLYCPATATSSAWKARQKI